MTETGVGAPLRSEGKRGVHIVDAVSSEPNKRTLTKSFVLKPGLIITVVAYTRANDVASSRVRTVHYTTAPPPSRRRPCR